MEGEQEEENVSLTGGETDNGADDSQTLTDTGTGLNEGNENAEENPHDASGSSESFDIASEGPSNSGEIDKLDQRDQPDSRGEVIQDPKLDHPSDPVAETVSSEPIEDISGETVKGSDETVSKVSPVAENVPSQLDKNLPDTDSQKILTSDAPLAPVLVTNMVTENKFPKPIKEVEGIDKRLAEVSDCPNLSLVDKVLITDVTTEKGTITVKECTTDEGFFAINVPPGESMQPSNQSTPLP